MQSCSRAKLLTNSNLTYISHTPWVMPSKYPELRSGQICRKKSGFTFGRGTQNEYEYLECYVSRIKSEEFNYSKHVLIEKVISVLRNHIYDNFFLTLFLKYVIGKETAIQSVNSIEQSNRFTIKRRR